MRAFGRRQFIQQGALALGATLITSGVSFARADSDTKSRFVFVILRGALDGLAVVPPYADPDYARLRGDLALHAPGSAGGVLPLNNLFGLHPSCTFLHDCFTARELVVFHALASPYRERSHFDGQDVLENGHVRPHAVQTGWLNRALAAMPARGSERERGVALGQNVPLLMRGPAAVTSWSPSKLAALDDDTLQRITDLYASDPLLAKRLADALAADEIAGSAMQDGAEASGMLKTAATVGPQSQGASRAAGTQGSQGVAALQGARRAGESQGVAASQGARQVADMRGPAASRGAPQVADMRGPAASQGAPQVADMQGPAASQGAPQVADMQGPAASQDAGLLAKRGNPGAHYGEVVNAAAGFLRRDDGPQVAVFDTTGWDTHANEGSAEGQLAARLAALDAGLRTLKEQLGPVWRDTAVVLATEFGRTAAINGTRGTDHGTGAAAFLVGGAVQGGRVVADWPGLSTRALYQGRDLQPTLDLRSVLKGVLQEHLLVPYDAVESSVFPDSQSAKAVRGLIRT